MEKNELLNNFLNEEPYIGMPIEGLRVDRPDDIAALANNYCPQVDSCQIAMAYVPWQTWNTVYSPELALSQGTLFPELDLPFLGGGNR
ncbi:spore coat associated protein CotJA [Anaerovorax odorimutans]|uniref:spore coat associated protein CotJA n=1 Tax=Anaerovorax odorimutans TaxID=109327 RepID=UPI00041D6B3A|nr:spore coat associated protein CotJA [Anaerovorax odorimutans]